MTTNNFSLPDITEVYQEVIAGASAELEKAKDAINADATPQNTMAFQTALGIWQLMTTTAINSVSSVADTLKEGLRAR